MSSYFFGKSVEILLIEDNPADTRLLLEAFKDGKVSNHISTVADGIDALAFLRKEGIFSKAKKPDIIFLDLNLPKKDGREVLREIKSDSNLKNIPVVVLTSSSAEEDILRSYDLHANCYVNKPVDLDQFFNIVKSIENFWLTIVKLPPRENHD